MSLPFTLEQFKLVFHRYNLAIWPAQMLALLIGVLVLLPILRGKQKLWPSQLGLALMWLTVGFAYHYTYFRQINSLAAGFAGACIVQGLLLLVARNAAKPQETLSTWKRVAGWAMVIYSMVVYPLIGLALGHAFPDNPTFGVTPCPTTMFTLGVLTICAGRLPRYLVVIPVIWSLIGTSAALNLGFWEDIALIPAAVVTAIIVTPRPTMSWNQANSSNAH